MTDSKVNACLRDGFCRELAEGKNSEKTSGGPRGSRTDIRG